jgi:CheY-like chemotaxis protein
MPRLLLVDDNPSIHKIAETLLAATDVHLTCAASGAEALALIEQGPAFDVALLDTSMMIMDGWELLERLRGLEATARIPVAMMAGVLDVVDPERISQAPIQGFLKKPVELRDLGDRIKRLLETPVPPPAPRPEPVAEPMAASPFLTQPGIRLADHPALRASRDQGFSDDDLILLGPEDIYRGDAEPEAAPLIEPAALQTLNDTLDLEELDIDSLRGLALQPEQPLVTFEDSESYRAPEAFDLASSPEDTPTVEELPAIPEYAASDAFPAAQDMDEGNSVTTGELPDLGPEWAVPAPEPPPAPAPVSELFDWSDDSDSLVISTPTPRSEFPPIPEEEAASIDLADILDPGPAAATAAEAAAESEDGLLLDLISDVMLTGDLGTASDPTTHLREFEGFQPSAAEFAAPPAGADTGQLEGFHPEDFPPPAEPAAEQPETLAEAGFMIEPEFQPEPEAAQQPETLVEPEAGFAPETPVEPEVEFAPEILAEPEAEFAPEISAEPEAEAAMAIPAEPEAEVAMAIPVEPEAEVAMAIPAEPEAEVAMAIPVEPEAEVAMAIPAEVAVPVLAEPHAGIPAEPPVPAQPAAGSAATALAAPAVNGGTQPAEALAALLADPILMDQLARAVVARLGEQALREIAWEIMPELADRLHRN